MNQFLIGSDAKLFTYLIQGNCSVSKPLAVVVNKLLEIINVISSYDQK